MDTQIFYFTGTGNSLAIARKILARLDTKGELFFMNKGAGASSQAQVIGFVLPIYYMDVPEFAADFIRSMKLPKDAYYFAVVNSNGYHGQGLSTIKSILKSKGITLNFGAAVDMPGNAILSNDAVNAERLAKLDAEVDRLCQYIKAKKSNVLPDKKNFVLDLQVRLMKFYGSKIAFNTKKFQVSSQCSKCGTCVKVCPRKNIKLAEQPVWGEDCVNCLACFHWCPEEAISMKNMLIGKRKKYHHPEVTIKDMLLK